VAGPSDLGLQDGRDQPVDAYLLPGQPAATAVIVEDCQSDPLYRSVADIDSIRSFAGENWQEAVIDPSEEEMLEETSIAHFVTLDTD